MRTQFISLDLMHQKCQTVPSFYQYDKGSILEVVLTNNHQLVDEATVCLNVLSKTRRTVIEGVYEDGVYRFNIDELTMKAETYLVSLNVNAEGVHATSTRFNLYVLPNSFMDLESMKQTAIIGVAIAGVAVVGK